jgi:hypothetical protein
VLLIVLACVASFGIPRIIHNATAGRHSACSPGPIPQAASLNAAEIQEAVSVMGALATARSIRGAYKDRRLRGQMPIPAPIPPG